MRNGRNYVVVAMALAVAGVTACTSAGDNPPGRAGSAATPANPAATPGSSSGTTPRPAGTTAPAGTGAPTSVPVVVPTGTKAPYPTPGKVPAEQPNQASVLASLPGRKSSSCAVVRGARDVRAGSVAAGNFQSVRQYFRSNYGKTETTEIPMYVIPQHAGHLSRMTARIAALGEGTSRTLSSKSVEAADAYRYFAVQLPIARPGKYRLTFVSGQDRGCFLISLKA
jgi:hypothetical protein